MVVSKWPLVALEDVVLDAQSGFASGERFKDGVIQIRMNNVTTDGHLDLSTYIRVPIDQKGLIKFTLETGDVLFNSTNSPELVGKNTVFNGYKELLVFSNHFLRLRLKKELINPWYLSHWFVVQWQNRVFESLSTQWVNQASVRKDDLLNLQIPLPSLIEQQRIAAILQKADRLRRLRRYARQSSDMYLQSIFLEMFGDPEINPRGWEIDSLDRILIETKNGFGQRFNYSSLGTIVLRIRDVSAGFIDYSEPRRMIISATGINDYKLDDGDLLFVRVNGNPELVGRVAVFEKREEPVVFSDHIIRAKVDNKLVEPIYLSEILNSIYGIKQTRGVVITTAGQFTINRSGLSSIKIPYPPKWLQTRFLSVYKNYKKYKQKQIESERQAEHLFQTLLHRAFRGEL